MYQKSCYILLHLLYQKLVSPFASSLYLVAVHSAHCLKLPGTCSFCTTSLTGGCSSSFGVQHPVSATFVCRTFGNCPLLLFSFSLSPGTLWGSFSPTVCFLESLLSMSPSSLSLYLVQNIHSASLSVPAPLMFLSGESKDTNEIIIIMLYPCI